MPHAPTVLLLACLVLPASAAAAVPVNGVFETAIDHPHSYTNPFRDVTLEATFTSPGGKDTPFWGFFDGDGTGGPDRLDVKGSWTPDSGGEESGTVWKLRFMPTEAGTWTYTWSFSDGSDSGSGSFTATDTDRRPGVLRVDETWPRWVRNDEGFFYPTTIEMHYGEQLAYDIDEYRQNYDAYIAHGYNMIGFLALPVWDFNTWQVNPVNNGGAADPFITLWYQNHAHVEGDASTYDSDRMLLFTWKRLDQHIDYLAEQGVYVFPFQGFNVKHSGEAEVVPHGFSDVKYDWYVRYCMARLAPYYNMVWNNTWESSNGFGQLLAGLDAYDPWRHLRMRVASSGSNVDINDGDRAPEEVPATSDKPWWITENNDKTGLWGDSGGASGTAIMDQDKVRDLTWRYIMRSAPVFLLEVRYVGYRDPVDDIAPDWDSYATSSGAQDFGLAHQWVRQTTHFWRMHNADALVSSSGGHCLAEAGEQYLCYQTGGGTITLDLPAGSYHRTWFDIQTGATTSDDLDHAGGDCSLAPPTTAIHAVYLARQATDNSDPVIASATVFEDPVAGASTTLLVEASDADGDPLAYAWSAIALPAGAAPQIGSGEDPPVTFDLAGDYTFQVTVTDGRGGSSSTTVAVTVAQTASDLQITP